MTTRILSRFQKPEIGTGSWMAIRKKAETVAIAIDHINFCNRNP
jgi:hypothetical protein